MQAYAEGCELLEAADVVENVTEVFRSWREGTVIRSWLLDLLVARARRGPGPRPDPRLRRGLRRGPVDGRGGHRPRRRRRPAITAALFARFVSRQDDSPAMKAVAAMRNQFGGHATPDRAAAGGRRLGRGRARRHQRRLTRPSRVRHPPVAARLPLVRRPRPRAGAGGDRVRRPQRPGQDQPRRGDRLPLPPGLAPGRRRRARWSGSAPSRRLSARPVVRDGRTALLEVEITPGRANRARVNRSPLPRAREIARPAAHRAVRARRTSRWSRATRPSGAASSTTCSCSGRPGSPACAPTTTGSCDSATRC